jgi:predicted hotdog family 3-hydroxylacyl-ACP dehydratase
MNYPPIAELIPHAGPMILLDRVLDADLEHLTAEVSIRPDALFCDGQRVGGWVGIEYMAQAIGALAGWTARQNNDPIRIGFLVGTRQYRSHTPWFVVGETLHISVNREIDGDNGVSAVTCRITAPDGYLHAEATLTVFQPDNLEDFLEKS